MKKTIIFMICMCMIMTSQSWASSSNQVNLSDVLTTISLDELVTQNNALKKFSKFVFTKTGELIVSSTGRKRPKHGDLGDRKEVISAGYISINVGTDGAIIILNNKSNYYCPRFNSLEVVKDFLMQEIGEGTQVTLNKKNAAGCVD